jgi:hypothetical protein
VADGSVRRFAQPDHVAVPQQLVRGMRGKRRVGNLLRKLPVEIAPLNAACRLVIAASNLLGAAPGAAPLLVRQVRRFSRRRLGPGALRPQLRHVGRQRRNPGNLDLAILPFDLLANAVLVGDLPESGRPQLAVTDRHMRVMVPVVASEAGDMQGHVDRDPVSIRQLTRESLRQLAPLRGIKLMRQGQLQLGRKPAIGTTLGPVRRVSVP